MDALDECPEGQVRDMIEFFEDLARIISSNKGRLHICFSSRHYPHILIDVGLELILEDQEGHLDDIKTYVSTKLKAGKSKQIEQIKAQILEKASGIFLWVVFVVRILNEEYQKGRIYALQKRLQEIPTELNKLFKEILMRDGQNIRELVLCIQWILYAKKPLRREEFYYAIVSGQEPQSLSAWDVEQITTEEMERLVLSCFKGLAETIRSKPPQVQFIHESVREFLLRKDVLVDVWPEFKDVSVGSSHDQLKTCCYKYMFIDTSEHLNQSFLMSIASTEEVAAIRKIVNEKFPFLQYVVDNIMHHADVAEGEGVGQSAFLKDFALEAWIKLKNLLEPYQNRRYSQDASLLYIFAEKDLTNLIRSHLRGDPTLNIQGERYGSPLVAAFANGNKSAAKALSMMCPSVQSGGNIYTDIEKDIDRDFDMQRESLRRASLKRYQNLLGYLAEHGLISVLKLLLDNGADVNDEDRLQRTPLWWAASSGQRETVMMLIDRGADLDKSPQHRDLLLISAETGCEGLARLLLDRGVPPNVQDTNGRTALSWVAAEGHEVTVTLLLNKNANVNIEDDFGRSPLSRAAARGHDMIVMLLLDRGSDINSKDHSGRTPLSWAARRGHETVVTLFLDQKADVNLRDEYGQTPLSCAAKYGHETIITLLLKRGADINLKDKHGWTPLLLAAQNKKWSAVQLLLRKGADANPINYRKGTPLHLAAVSGQGIIVEHLLKEGAQIDPQDENGFTPLTSATNYRHPAIVRLLLEKGAKPNIKDRNDEGPLFKAARQGYETTVRLLLEKGAEVNSSGGRWQSTPLWEAAYRGNEGAVRLLLDKGAEVDSRDGLYQSTPLWQAVSSRNWAVVKWLLEEGADVDCSLNGITLREEMERRGRKEVVELLDDWKLHNSNNQLGMLFWAVCALALLMALQAQGQQKSQHRQVGTHENQAKSCSKAGIKGYSLGRSSKT